jgi:hypothetical protein
MAEANLGHPVLEKNFTTTKSGDKLIKNVLKKYKGIQFTHRGQ